MGSKKNRNSSKKSRQRHGLSGNPALRAEQLAVQETLAFGPGDMEAGGERLDALLSLARKMAGHADPAEWWPESHERVLECARAADWPSELAGIEETTCSIFGQQLLDNLAEYKTGHHLTQWLAALAEYTGAALRDAIAAGDGHGDGDGWPPLWALLRGIVLIAPPAATSDTSRQAFPDIKFADETALAEAGQAAKLLASRGLAAEWPVAEVRPTGAPLVARDSYGSRFLVVAPFGYSSGEAGHSGGEADHWYAWDVDTCWMDMLVAAGTFGSESEALAEWRGAVGASGAAAELSACAPDMAAFLLGSLLKRKAFMDMPHGAEPEELLREYFRSRRRARALDSAGFADDAAAEDGWFPQGQYAERTREICDEFRDWHAERYGKHVADVPLGAETIIGEWGPHKPFDERSFFACSPHRVAYAAHLISDGYLDDDAARAIGLLPDWVRYCAERTGVTGEAAERALAAARAAADLAAEKGPGAIPDPSAEGWMFRLAE